MFYYGRKKNIALTTIKLTGINKREWKLRVRKLFLRTDFRGEAVKKKHCGEQMLQNKLFLHHPIYLETSSTLSCIFPSPANAN